MLFTAAKHALLCKRRPKHLTYRVVLGLNEIMHNAKNICLMKKLKSVQFVISTEMG